MRIQEEKIELQKILHRRICVRNITFLVARPPSCGIFLPLIMQNRPKYITRFFYFVCKETTQKPLNVVAEDPFLQCVCYWYNLLR